MGYEHCMMQKTVSHVIHSAGGMWGLEGLWRSRAGSADECLGSKMHHTTLISNVSQKSVGCTMFKENTECRNAFVLFLS